MNDVGKPCAGEPHARFDRGALAEVHDETGRLLVPGRCAEKRHHHGLVGTSTRDHVTHASALPHWCARGLVL